MSAEKETAWKSEPTASGRTSASVWLASGLGFGFSPVASGTVGALWGLPLSWGLDQIESVWLRIGVWAVLCVIGIPLCTRAARQLGGRKDPGTIVYDEIVSLPMTYFALPFTPGVLVVGFLLNRVFDILKPPPARQLEALPEGLGIMADDLMAGVYSHLVLRVVVGLGWLT
jgi:phosphatidylglycerophosphatase A